MLREIRVYGRLAKFLGRRKFMAEVATVAEAVRFLVANFPQLERHMAEQHYKVIVGGREISEEELRDPTGALETIKVVPVIAGAGAVGRIIAGAALLVASFFIPPIAILGTTLGTIAFGIGASLVLGGVAQLLTPVPQITAPGGSTASTAETELDPQKSYSFSGIQNTSSQGTPVPIIYGETIVGSVVISTGIDTVQVRA
jgi:predicted phage tail protein